jgi:plasmid stabilization system protein ParE
MRIKWTAEAEAHLDGIYHYIAKDSPLYASRTLDKLTRPVPKYDIRICAN